MKDRKAAICTYIHINSKEYLMNYFPTLYQSVIYKSRYARWRDELGRREEWPETVARYFNFFEEHLKDKCSYVLTTELRKELEDAVLNLKVMPSMRSLMTAGPALKRCNVAGYNCSYLPIDNVRAFDEILYILMCGTGVGFGVEHKDVDKLPVINEHFESSSTNIIVDDSKQGWARIPSWDLTKLRPKGARLKTFGGRSSGPEPLNDLFKFVVEKLTNAAGRRLTPLECHDIVCKIGEVVVVGGVRRSALISLSNLDDRYMREAKSGRWWELEGQRALANNSAVYSRTPDVTTFLDEWNSLIKSQSGERGLFNRQAAIKQTAKNGRREANHRFGTNPCGEILLRPNEFCNLTEVVIRSTDLDTDLANKVKIATILGTFQSTLTDFKYLRKVWKENVEEERLLGVSLTGIYDRVDTNNLAMLRQVAVDTNKHWAEVLNIPVSAAITCVKPSGTVSQLVDSASGIHPRHSEYYIRTIRGDNKDPLTQFLIEAGIPYEADVMKPLDTTVFSFPQKAPQDAVTRKNLTAIQHLQYWLKYKQGWCEHNPSVTVSVLPTEWLDVGAWVYKNFDEVLGVSFLPHSEHTYKQAPYQECSKEQYEEALAKMPKELNWDKLMEFEKEDATTGTQELACMSGTCEIS
jgi:ribonucleoside-triphosphate reductase (thioredoxin)